MEQGRHAEHGSLGSLPERLCKAAAQPAESGNKIKTLATKEVKNGENIKTTIDINIQQKLYNEFKDDEGASVAMNYNTGEVLALVSTPSYDANDI